MRTTTVRTLSLSATHPSRDPRYITSREIAKRIGGVRNSISANYPRGTYPFKRVLLAGGVSYFDRAEVEQWLDEGARTNGGLYRIAPKART